jgi:2-polyprenyl-3-methyl-5-hydroxy-6-metoxy-1,4-benzoquinol methylase
VRALPFSDFDKLYQSTVRDVCHLCSHRMQEELSQHCQGWKPGRFDFENYLKLSTTRFFNAYRSLVDHGSFPVRTICDVGGFFGVFPVTLKKLGFQVTMTESLQYYGEAFSPLFRFIEGEGVSVVDYDPFRSERTPGQFDAVTVVAMLEHYPHSLMRFMKNVVSMALEGGNLYIEVPNIAHWPKRIGLLRGRSPLVPLRDIYLSAEPFIGHHHEFTMEELRDLADLSGIRIEREYCFSYSETSGIWQRLRDKPVGTIAQAFLPDARECLAILCKKGA